MIVLPYNHTSSKRRQHWLRVIKDYVREHRRRRQEMFVPLDHPPGHAQADFGEAVVVIGGVEQKAHFFVMDLPHSDAYFVRAYPAAPAEAWMDGHVHAFTFFGGVPQSILYDNDRCLLSKIQPDGTRVRATLFSGLLSHYLLRDRYGRPGKGNDKGNVEGMVGYARRNHMVPVPCFPDWESFNAHLEAQCRPLAGFYSAVDRADLVRRCATRGDTSRTIRNRRNLLF